jgi:hypothetical protein
VAVPGGVADDDLDVALVRLYQQTDEPADWRITVDAVEPGPQGEAFVAHVRSLVDPDREPFSSFMAAAGELVRERRIGLERMLTSRLDALGS